MEHLIVECSITLGCALDCSTQASYSSALNSYLIFCQLHHLDPEPTINTLSLYITFMSHHIEPHSVCSYLAGIVSELEPSYPCVQPNKYSPLVVQTLKRSMRHFSAPLQQKAPLTRDDLKHVYQHLPRPLSHDNLLFLTMLLVGFFGLLRLGELVQPDSSSLHIMSKISLRHDVHLDAAHLSFAIPQSKTDVSFEGDQVVIQKSPSASDPYSHFCRYLVSQDILFPLFPQLWPRSNGPLPSRSWFLSRLHSFFPCSIGGHFIYAGGATSLAAAGVPPSQIQAIGRWRSDTFECYIHCHPTLLQAVLFHGQSIHDPLFADVLYSINTILFIHTNSSLPSWLTPFYRVPSGLLCIYLPLGPMCGAPSWPSLCWCIIVNLPLCHINAILFIHTNTTCPCTIPSLPPSLTSLYRVPSGSWCIYLPLGLVCGALQFPCIINIIRVVLLQLNLLASSPGPCFPRLRSIGQ